MPELEAVKEAVRRGIITEDEGIALLRGGASTTGQGVKFAGADNQAIPEKKSMLDPRNWTPEMGIRVPEENAASALNPWNWDWKGSAAPAASMLALAGTGGMSLPIQLGASGLASMIGDLGESGYRALAGDKTITPQSAARSATMQGTVDLAANALPMARPLVQGMKSALPFEKTGANMLIDQMAKPVEKTAARVALEDANQKGIGVPPSTFLEEDNARRVLARVAEGLADLTNLGAMRTQAYTERLFKKVNKEADEFLNKSKRSVGEIGENFVQWVEYQADKNMDDSLRKKGSDLYNAIYEPLGGKAAVLANPNAHLVPLKNFKAALSSTVKGVEGSTGLTPKLKDLKEIYLDRKGQGKIPVNRLEDLYKKIKIGSHGTMDDTIAMKNAISEDIKAYNPKVHTEWETARENFEDLQIDFVKNPILKGIMGIMRGASPKRKDVLKIDSVVSQVFNSAHLGSVEKIFNEAPPEMVDELKTRFLANFFDPRSAIGKRVVGEVSDSTLQYIKGKELRLAIKDNEAILNRFYPPEVVTALKNLADKAELGSGLTNNFIASSKHPIEKKLGQGVRMVFSGGLTAGAGPIVAGGAELSGLFLANSLMKPNGWAKTLLVGGEEGTKKSGLRLGGQALKFATSKSRENRNGK